MRAIRKRASRMWAGSDLNVLGTLVRVRTSEPAAALTFDDGPHPEYTPALLQILRRHRARGTFFVLGAAAAKYPEIVEAISRAGHVVAHHSWDHLDFTVLSSAERRSQFRRCAEQIGHVAAPLFRPPYGYQNRSSRIAALRERLDVVGWSADIEDWVPQSSERLAGRLTEAIAPGRIILLHDAIRGRDREVALDRVPLLEAIDHTLGSRSDFEFLTIPELLSRGSAVRAPWNHMAAISA